MCSRVNYAVGIMVPWAAWVINPGIPTPRNPNIRLTGYNRHGTVATCSREQWNGDGRSVEIPTPIRILNDDLGFSVYGQNLRLSAGFEAGDVVHGVLGKFEQAVGFFCL